LERGEVVVMPSLRHGDRGPGVTQLQHALRSAGYFVGSEDGAFGLQTDAAVRYLQSCHGLAIDGVAGDATLTALGVNVGTVSEIELKLPAAHVLESENYQVTVRCTGSSWPRVRLVAWFRNAGGQEHSEVTVDTPAGEVRPAALPVPESIRAHGGECHVTVYVFDAGHGTQLEEAFASFQVLSAAKR
jgi:peptidoglycan hydrolase-like protein with peptidoglycan-binding domain